MSAYQRGQAINLVNRFWVIDPVTEEATPTNPTTVTFKILAPNNVETEYVFAVDVNVTNPLTGTFVCSLSPPLPPGTYRYRCDGTGAVEASSEDFFDVLESGVLAQVDPTVPITGPCSSWINGDDVNDAGPDIDGINGDTYLLDDVAYAASDILYNLSGRQFPGVCERQVRPCRDPNHDCFGGSVASGLAFYWTTNYLGGWYWGNDRGQRCGCGWLEEVLLAGYPVRKIISVTIDGDALPEFDVDTGARNWRLDDRRRLVRMASPGPPVVKNFWPNCQNLALDADQPGTFAVTYTWGADVPLVGRQAAAQLARELWAALNTGTCQLPTKVTKVVRAGITLEKLVAVGELLWTASTGLQFVDAFLATYNKSGEQRRSAVWSPDRQQFARKVGQ